MALDRVFVNEVVCGSDVGWALSEVLREFVRDGDTDVVLDLIRAFKDDTAVRLCDLRNAAAGGDRASLKGQAHTIKGSARQMGATALADVCERLELASSDRPVSELITYTDNVEAEFTKAWQAMFAYSPQDFGAAGNRSE